MKDFRGGVDYYTRRTLTVAFPEDDVVCHWCPLLSNDYKLGRARCLHTGEIIPAPGEMRGDRCPMTGEE